ncbi:MAG: zinc metallopeptidase [Silicimonas sp.]|nr:zinc metallopeptidase [Silicimonas sp.]NNL35141.1 zinc metallopeptidase [Silicimonas sp.]RZW05329.1 MAG: zinc metallopeptidase [Paracoccaceae bacterium]
MFDDPLIWILILPGMLLGGFAQSRVKAAVSRYSRVPLGHGLTGAEVAQHILNSRGLRDVRIEPVRGVLSDHYDPREKVLRLSEAVYGVRSVAAAGIAAHEVGHAIQDADDYAPMEFRSAIVPLVKVGSTVAPLAFIGGLLIGSQPIMWLGAILFGASSLFALVTLPVEFDASRRALKHLEGLGIIQTEAEMDGARKVLRAAAWTYVAAAIAAVGSWLMYLLLSRRR